MCVCVCVCVERERERERENVCETDRVRKTKQNKQTNLKELAHITVGAGKYEI